MQQKKWYFLKYIPHMPMVVIGVSRLSTFKLNIKKDIGKNYPTEKLGDFRDLETDSNRLNFRLVCSVLGVS